MTRSTCEKGVSLFVGAGLCLALAGCPAGEGPIVPPPPAPPEYADKHMPEGYWGNKEIIEEGRQLFIGATNIDVNCASCHGKDGKPVKAGARDFRTTDRMKLYSDSVWFWRVSEGVPNTKMKPWKSKLSEDDRWKVIAFESTFGLDGMEYRPAQKAWVPIGSPAPSPNGAPAGAEPKGEPKGEAKGEGDKAGEKKK